MQRDVELAEKVVEFKTLYNSAGLVVPPGLLNCKINMHDFKLGFKVNCRDGH